MGKEAIEGLKPEILWQRFYEISQIPRPSKKEEKVVQYLRDFAEQHNLEMKEDKVGNIVMKLPAKSGYEKAPTVVLQGHVDMVAEKNKGTEHDFEKDPIELIRDGEWIKANGTTLGSDNGIGVAAGLAVVSDNEVVHGPLELLFTIDEETGMTGVNNLEPGFIEGKTLLNMDSEEDGAFYVGCAGGQDTVGYFDIHTTDCTKTFEAYEVIVSGLKGGHSGLDIQEGRANAIKLLARFLTKLHDVSFEVADISGGSKRNAIPREAEALLMIDPRDEVQLKTHAQKFKEEAAQEFRTVDPKLDIQINKKEEFSEKVFSREFTKKLVDLLLALPHGIIAMNQDIPGLVETSTNLATLSKEDGKLRIGTSQRSSTESAKEYISSSVVAAFSLAEAEVNVGDGYPGWKPNMDSKLLETSKNVYKEKYNSDPEIKAIHAGLECGILGNKYPGLDMISFGPTIENAHSPDERVNIKDVEKFYDLLKGILANFANRK